MKNLKEKPMPEIEKANKKQSDEEEPQSELCQDYLRQAANPNKPTKEELLARLTKELDDLAVGCGMTAKELFYEAEFGQGKKFREEHFQAIVLHDQIGHLKSIMKKK